VTSEDFHADRRAGPGRGQYSACGAALCDSPLAYSTQSCLWLLSELFEQLPKSGDLDKPRFVAVLCEAHLCLRYQKSLVDRIERWVRLISSKGVRRSYFVSQSPLDVPRIDLGQLGIGVRMRCALYPKDQRKLYAVRHRTFAAIPR